MRQCGDRGGDSPLFRSSNERHCGAELFLEGRCQAPHFVKLEPVGDTGHGVCKENEFPEWFWSLAFLADQVCKLHGGAALPNRVPEDGRVYWLSPSPLWIRERRKKLAGRWSERVLAQGSAA